MASDGANALKINRPLYSPVKRFGASRIALCQPTLFKQRQPLYSRVSDRAMSPRAICNKHFDHIPANAPADQQHRRKSTHNSVARYQYRQNSLDAFT